jgi:predicted transcriptional regulator
MPRKKAKIIQVPVQEDLLNQLDRLAEESGESRSSVIREACAEYITSRELAEKIRQYEQGYTDHPEEDDGDWRDRNAAVVWGHEDWTEDYRESKKSRAEG